MKTKNQNHNPHTIQTILIGEKKPPKKDTASFTKDFLKLFIYNRVESKTSSEIWKMFYLVIC